MKNHVSTANLSSFLAEHGATHANVTLSLEASPSPLSKLFRFQELLRKPYVHHVNNLRLGSRKRTLIIDKDFATRKAFSDKDMHIFKLLAKTLPFDDFKQSAYLPLPSSQFDSVEVILDYLENATNADILATTALVNVGSYESKHFKNSDDILLSLKAELKVDNIISIPNTDVSDSDLTAFFSDNPVIMGVMTLSYDFKNYVIPIMDLYKSHPLRLTYGTDCQFESHLKAYLDEHHPNDFGTPDDRAYIIAKATALFDEFYQSVGNDLKSDS